MTRRSKFYDDLREIIIKWSTYNNTDDISRHISKYINYLNNNNDNFKNKIINFLNNPLYSLNVNFLNLAKFGYDDITGKGKIFYNNDSKDKIQKFLNDHNVSLLLVNTPTGSGKSSKLPWMFLGRKRNKILITEPKILNVNLISDGLSFFLQKPVGSIVGYKTSRGQNIDLQKNLIMVFTERTLLNILIKKKQNNILDKYLRESIIIIDEAHEKSDSLEGLLYFIKINKQLTKGLKLIIMSATLKGEKYDKYFNLGRGQVKKIEILPGQGGIGTGFDIKNKFLDRDISYDSQSFNNYFITAKDLNKKICIFDNNEVLVNYIKKNHNEINFIDNVSREIDENKKYIDDEYSVLMTNNILDILDRDIYYTNYQYAIIFEIYKYILENINKPKKKGILVFLTSSGDIRYIKQYIEEHFNHDVEIIEMYSKNMIGDEKLKSNPDKISIFLSTDMAETGIRIDGLEYCIDSCMTKKNFYDPNNNADILKDITISKSSSTQRRGRVGRDFDGIYKVMVCENTYNQLTKSPYSPIQTKNLDVITLLSPENYENILYTPNNSQIEIVNSQNYIYPSSKHLINNYYSTLTLENYLKSRHKHLSYNLVNVTNNKISINEQFFDIFYNNNKFPIEYNFAIITSLGKKIIKSIVTIFSYIMVMRGDKCFTDNDNIKYFYDKEYPSDLLYFLNLYNSVFSGKTHGIEISEKMKKKFFEIKKTRMNILSFILNLGILKCSNISVNEDFDISKERILSHLCKIFPIATKHPKIPFVYKIQSSKKKYIMVQGNITFDFYRSQIFLNNEKRKIERMVYPSFDRFGPLKDFNQILYNDVNFAIGNLLPDKIIFLKLFIGKNSKFGLFNARGLYMSVFI